MDGRIGYDADFYAWTQEQARLLREAAGQHIGLPLDFGNLAEEVESIGRRDLREVKGRLRRVIGGLLKLQYVPGAEEDREFRLTIMHERFDAELILEDSPSLRAMIDLADLYGGAVKLRSKDTAIKAAAPFPVECPYSLEQLLDLTWWPVNRHGVE